MKSIFIALSLICVQLIAQKIEGIDSFRTDITLEKNGSALITEYITIRSDRVKFIHGIYRNIPKSYSIDSQYYEPEIISCSRNGKEEETRVISKGAMWRIYIGNNHYKISKGKHRYVLKYRCYDQFTEKKSGDFFKWNISGSLDNYSINKLTVTIQSEEELIPYNIALKRLNKKGKLLDSFSVHPDAICTKIFSTSRIKPGTNFIVAANYPLNSFPCYKLPNHPPTKSIGLPLSMKITGPIFSFVILIVSLFLIKKTTIGEQKILTKEPPNGLSPAVVTYVHSPIKNSSNYLQAAILSMQSKNYLSVNSDDTGTIYLLKTNKMADPLSVDEIVCAKELFRQGDSVDIIRKNKNVISNAMIGLQKSINKKVRNDNYLHVNKLFHWLLVSMQLITCLYLVFIGKVSALGVFFTCFMGYFIAGILWHVTILKIPDAYKEKRFLNVIWQLFIFFGVQWLFSFIVLKLALQDRVNADYILTLLSMVWMILYYGFYLQHTVTDKGQLLRNRLLGYKEFLKEGGSGKKECIPIEQYIKELAYAKALLVEEEYLTNSSNTRYTLMQENSQPILPLTPEFSNLFRTSISSSSSYDGGDGGSGGDSGGGDGGGGW